MTFAEEIKRECDAQGMDLALPKNAFVVAALNPQGGWYLEAAADLGAAQLKARRNFGKLQDVFVMSADPKHGLFQLAGDDFKAV